MRRFVVEADKQSVTESPILPELVAVRLRSIDPEAPLSNGAIDRFPSDGGDRADAVVASVCDGAIEVTADQQRVLGALKAGLRARLAAPVVRGEVIRWREGHATG